MRIFITIITLLIISSISLNRLFAQDYLNIQAESPDSLIEEDKKMMESMMVWKLTEELDLEVEQADKFFPRFREHRKELDDLRSKDRVLGMSLNTDMKNMKELTGSEVNKIIKKRSALRKKMADLEEKFLLNSGDILNPKQQAKLGLFKSKMMRNMKGKMKKKQKRRGMRDGKNFKKGKKRNKRGYWD
tara:strand:+ start:145 stop:708 length:564 start_codon:yes stop_codon:yes gene_type:complete